MAQIATVCDNERHGATTSGVGDSVNRRASPRAIAADCVLVTVAARELGVHRSTVYRMKRAGKVQLVHFEGDNRAYVRRRDLEALKQPQPKAADRRCHYLTPDSA